MDYYNMNKFTELDNLAYKLFVNKYDIIRSKSFFVHYRDALPYKEYYDKAKSIIRVNKIKKLKNEI